MARNWIPPPGFYRLHTYYRQQQRLVRKLASAKLCLREISQMRARLRRLNGKIDHLERVLVEGGAP